MKDYQPIQTSQMPKSEKLKNMAWGVINATLFRITPPRPSENPDFKGFLACF